METKLTLTLDKNVADSAKAYAKAKNTTLSKFIENILARIMADNSPALNISLRVKNLSGVLKNANEEDYSSYLEQKYK